MLRDLALAARTLAKRPGYASSVVLTLTVGIGAGTMMFSLLDAAVLQPLPFRDPARLVGLLGVAGPDRVVRGASFPEAHDWRSLNRTLEDVAIYDEISLNLRIGTEAIRVDAELVSAGFFGLLGVSPALGRAFLSEEDTTPDARPVAVISHDLWRQRFGGRRDALDRPVFFNDREVAIVGVMPEGFAGLSFDTDVWVPSMMVSLTSAPGVVTSRGTRWLTVLGRLKPGVTVERAQDDLSRVAALLEAQHPDTNRQRGVQVLPLQEMLLGATGPLVTALFGAVVLFLVIACANVASLHLARTIARRRELAVRLALGASRWHLLRQLLAESLVLAAAAGAAGAIVAAWSLGAVTALMPAGALPRYVEAAVDPRALAFATLISLAAGALVAMLPAWTSARRDVIDAMKEGARSVAGGLGTLRRRSAQQLLVVGEIALAMTLLIGAAVMLRSLERQLQVPVGFNPAGLTVARISLPGARYAPPQRAAFAERLAAELAAVPGVASASVSSDLPFTGTSSASSLIPDAGSADDAVRYYRHFVTPDYFETLGVPILQGRGFSPRDSMDAPPVAIVSEASARRLFGAAADAVGRRIQLGQTAPRVEIVGVAGNARFRDLTTDILATTAEPDVFFPFAQRTDRDIQLAVRSHDGSPVSIALLQTAVAGIDGGLPVYAVQLLDEALAQQTATARFGSALLSIFSSGALFLAAVGLYGLVSYVVGLSGREIAIRLALGAQARQVILVILGNGLALVAGGVLLGLAAAFLAGRALEGQLFQTTIADPAAVGTVAVLLVAVAALATLLPARRAAGIDPHTALRAE
jgi:predicted permease